MDDRAQQLHAQIRQAIRDERAAVHTQATLLAELDRDQLYRQLGFRTLQDYAWRKHQLKQRRVRDLVRLGRGLSDLPQLNSVLANGELEWTKARAVLPVLDSTNEALWVERALQSTTREHQGGCQARSACSRPPVSAKAVQVGG